MIRKLFLLSLIMIVPVAICAFLPKQQRASTSSVKSCVQKTCPSCSFMSNALVKSSDQPIDIDRDYGSEPVSPGTRVIVTMIQNEMGLTHTTVIMRKMNNKAIETMGYGNSFVTCSGDQWYLFVSEEWFKSLTMAEKRFVIGHELAHIIYNHPNKIAYMQNALKLALDYGNNYLEVSKGDEEAQKIQRIGLDNYKYVLGMTAERAIEVEADKLAITRLKCADGARALAQRFDYLGVAGQACESHPSWTERAKLVANNYRSVPNALKL